MIDALLSGGITEFEWLDIEADFDGSSDVFAEDFEIQHLEAIQEYHFQQGYQNWLEKRYTPKLSYGAKNCDQIDPRDKWMDDSEKLTTRRNGEMLYQRL